ncbi:AI-2E family transporter [Candidatus Peregrinibacteria bacterium]|nr:AI-2E family transporter [Candidatus Peregrinibacteria bacterium]
MNNFQSILKTALLLIFIYLSFILVQPFIGVVTAGVVFAIIFYPLFLFFHKKLKVHNGLAAFATVLLSTILVIFPLLSLIPLLIREALIFSHNFNVNDFLHYLQSFSGVDFFGYKFDWHFDPQTLIDASSSVGPFIAAKGLEITSQVSNSIGIFLIFLVLYYYFLKDSEYLAQNLRNILPYEKKEQTILIDSFKKVATTVFIGNFLTALISGIMAFVGFWIFGFPSPIIWALLAVMLSFIPTAGPFLLYFLGALILCFSSNWLAALGLALYFGIMEMGLRENWLKPKLLDDQLSFHPVFIFFALIGGVSAFGSLGLLYGPLILTFAASLYQFTKKVNKNHSA